MFLDEYLQGDLTPNRLPPTWVSRTKFVYQSDDGNLAVYESTNNTVKTLVTNHTLVSAIHIRIADNELTNYYNFSASTKC